MSEERVSKERLLEISEQAFVQIVKGLGEDGCARPVDMMCILAIMYRITFANVEKQAGIDEARKSLGGIMELIQITLDEGAWDEEMQMMK